jgi:hypothetical protein
MSEITPENEVAAPMQGAAATEEAGNTGSTPNPVDGTAAPTDEQMVATLLEHASHARTDAIAVRWENRDKSGYKPRDGAITDADVRKHLSRRGPHLGIYVMPVGDSTRMAVFDLDDHDGSTGWDVIMDKAKGIVGCLEPLGCRPLVFISGGGKGIHIFLMWREPQSAKAVRALMTTILASLSLRDGDGGVGKGEIEVFPKHNSVKADGYGALIALPLGRQSAALSPVSWAETTTWAVRHAPDVSVLESMWKVRNALSFLPSDDHGQWIAFGHAIQHEFGDDGFALWDEWARRSDKYDGQDKSRRKWDHDLRADGKVTIRSIFAAAEEAGWQGRPAKSRENERVSQTDAMVEMVGSCELWHSETGNGYITIRDSGPPRNLPITHADFKGWLTINLRKVNGKAPNNSALEETVRELNAIARFERPEYQTWLRVGQSVDRSKVYLDLGRPDWKVVEIDAVGWRLIDEAPIKFRRSNGKELPIPQGGGSIDLLRDFLNVGDDEFMLVVCWLLKCFLPDVAFPILWLAGEQGTAKTTALQVCRSLVDPAKAMVRSMARTEDNLMVAALNNWVVTADNLSHVDDDMSDALCRLATKGGLSKRTHYTDGDEFTIDAMRPQLYSGISLGSQRPDWLSRLVYVKLQPIPDGKRMTERRFWAKFNTAWGSILGVLLDGVSMGLRRIDEVENRVEAGELMIPRLGDFCTWVMAAAPAYGWSEAKVLTTFMDMQRSIEQAAAESDTAVRALREYVEGLADRRFEGHMAQLHAAVELANPELHSDKFWPKSPSALGRKMDRIAPLLRALGFKVSDRPDNDNKNVYVIAAPPLDIGEGEDVVVMATLAELQRQRDAIDQDIRSLLNGGGGPF